MHYRELNELSLYTSEQDVMQLAEKLSGVFRQAGFKLFLQLDQAAEAEKVGLSLPPTVVMMIGIPEKGTVLMNSFPTMRYELPIKIVITRDEHDNTVVLHPDFAAIARKHGIDIPLFPFLGELIQQAK